MKGTFSARNNTSYVLHFQGTEDDPYCSAYDQYICGNDAVGWYVCLYFCAP